MSWSHCSRRLTAALAGVVLLGSVPAAAQTTDGGGSFPVVQVLLFVGIGVLALAIAAIAALYLRDRSEPNDPFR